MPVTHPPACRPPDLGGDTLAAVLSDAVSRLKENGTWKRWRWFLSDGGASQGKAYIH